MSVGRGAVGAARRARQRSTGPVGYEFAYGGQAQMMAEMQADAADDPRLRPVLLPSSCWPCSSTSLKLPLYVLAGVPVSLTGLVILLYLTGIPLGSTVIIGLLVVVAANVMEGVLLLNYAEEIRSSEHRSPLEAVIQAARIRFRPRMMTATGVLVGLPAAGAEPRGRRRHAPAHGGGGDRRPRGHHLRGPVPGAVPVRDLQSVERGGRMIRVLA
ncbi:MAG: efflux RND transporter permease subunit [Desulfobacterales bacterium]|nr:efflux RND transporter permease subunit [Desulfobacterales bacterium]